MSLSYIKNIIFYPKLFIHYILCYKIYSISYRTKIRRTKFSADKTFQRTIFSAPLKSMSWKNIFIAKLLYRNTNQVDVKFVGQKFGGQNFRHLAEFSAILSAEFLSDKVIGELGWFRNFPLKFDGW